MCVGAIPPWITRGIGRVMLCNVWRTFIASASASIPHHEHIQTFRSRLLFALLATTYPLQSSCAQ